MVIIVREGGSIMEHDNSMVTIMTSVDKGFCRASLENSGYLDGYCMIIIIYPQSFMFK